MAKKDPKKITAYWTKKLEKARKGREAFTKQADKASDAARDDDKRKNPYNITWSLAKITRSAIYANVPKPDVRRRYQKPDPNEKELARMVERAIEYHVDSGTFDAHSHMAVKDFVEVGLGVPRIIYDVAVSGEEGEQQITSQSVGIEHTPWRYFHWEPGRSWEKVRWIAFESYTTRFEIEEEYGIKVKAGKDNDAVERDSEKYQDEVQVYEIWYKPTRTVYVVTPSHQEPLEVRKDKLNLQGFFPTPRPAFSNLKSDELLPKPDFCFIETQVSELNRISGRINKLSAQIKDLSAADASIVKDIGSVASKADGSITPVHDLTAKFAAAGGGRLQDAIWHMPMLEKAQTVAALQEQREALKDQIYDITGLSDIVRGSTKASETAAAQTLKGQWANVRLSEKTSEVARLWRETFRIFAEIICEHFDPMMLELQTGIQVTPEMQQIMQNDIGRSFAIDIETDSTIRKDDADEREQSLTLVNTLLEKVQQCAPAVAQGFLPPEFVQETLLLAVGSFKHAKQLEDAIMGLGPHLANMQQFQQQMQQIQQQLMQAQHQLQAQGGQLQQAGQANQQLQGKLAQFNERKEARADAETQAKVAKEAADTEAQRIENQIVGSGIEVKEQMADIGKTVAETNKINKETAFLGVVSG